jgi:hypothetical protein
MRQTGWSHTPGRIGSGAGLTLREPAANDVIPWVPEERALERAQSPHVRKSLTCRCDAVMSTRGRVRRASRRGPPPPGLTSPTERSLTTVKSVTFAAPPGPAADSPAAPSGRRAGKLPGRTPCLRSGGSRLTSLPTRLHGPRNWLHGSQVLGRCGDQHADAEACRCRCCAHI